MSGFKPIIEPKNYAEFLRKNFPAEWGARVRQGEIVKDENGEWQMGCKGGGKGKGKKR